MPVRGHLEFSSDRRKFIQMNWLSEFHLPLPRGRANQAKLGTHSRNSSGPKRQTSSKPAGPEDSSVWLLFPSVWFSSWVMFREPFPNSLDVIPLLWGQDFSVAPCRSEREVLRHFSRGLREKPHQCRWQGGRRLRKMTDSGTAFALSTETETPREWDAETCWLGLHAPGAHLLAE